MIVKEKEEVSLLKLQSFGDSLKFWRELHRKTQLDLAMDLDVSTKHLSFLENNRSTPSRQMVLKIAEVLRLPLRQRNSLLLAAGYAPEFKESALSDQQIQSVAEALQRLIDKQEPFPAFVVNTEYKILNYNQGFRKLISKFVGDKALQIHENAIEILCSETGLKPYVEHYEIVENFLKRRLFDEILISQNPKLLDLYQKLFSNNPMNELLPLVDMQIPILSLRLRKENLCANFFSTITTLGTPLDVTLQELKIECFFPMDEETKCVLSEP